MIERTYAQALINVTSRDGADEKKSVDNLVAQLKASGRMKLLPRILGELRAMTMHGKTLAGTVEVAHEKDSAHALKIAKEAGMNVAHTTVNKSLISGFRLRAGGTLRDESGKRALIDLYRKIVS